MAGRIDLDVERFDARIRRLKDGGLKRYFSDGLGEIDVGGRVLRIPVRHLEIPRLRYVLNEGEMGVSMGEGDVGTLIPPQQGQPQQQRDEDEQGGGRGQSRFDEEEDGFLDEHLHPGGKKRARRMYTPVRQDIIEVSREEVAEGLEKHLKLPNLRKTLGANIILKTTSKRYQSVRTVGPRSLTDRKRTYTTALKRMVATGEYEPETPIVIPRNEDRRYRAQRDTPDKTNAVIVYLLDCSGSMMNTLDFLQDTAWLADCWIEHEYPSVARRYVHYDHFARESSRDEFYNISAGGENNMGIAYLRACRILDEYQEDQYSRFLIHLTDGDHFGLEVDEEDAQEYQQATRRYPEYFPEMQIVGGNPLINRILPRVNALFVCEAGAYYKEDEPFKHHRGVGISKSNYSELLDKMIKDAPSLREKIRLVSFREEEIRFDRMRCKMDTMKTWFG